MPYDVASVRAHFPALAEGAAHFDGPGGSQTPDVVARAVADTLTSAISNRGGVTASERRAEQVVTDCRAALADLLGADPRGIVFGRSATALTYDLARALAKDWGPGDEVVVTRLDHDANIRPWVHAAEASGATVRWVDFDPAHGRAVGGCRRSRPLRPHPTGRHDRRLEPHRHPHPRLPGRRPGPRGGSAALGRRGARHRARLGRPRRAARRLLDLLALQVHGPALRRARRRPGTARDPAPRQAAPVDGCRARAVRARHPALRADGRHHRGSRLHRESRRRRGGGLPRRPPTTTRHPARASARQPARTDRAGHEGSARARAGAARRARARDPRTARRHGAQQRPLAHAHPAVHRGRS